MIRALFVAVANAAAAVGAPAHAALMWTNDCGSLVALAEGGSDVHGLWRWWSSSAVPG